MFKLKYAILITWILYQFSAVTIVAGQMYGNNEENSIQHSGYEKNTNGSWMDTAKNALSGPAGKMIVHVAKEMLSRSAGNSQILSLNLSNLLILVLLKALIFAAGLIGAGNWGQYARGRSDEGPSLIHADEEPLFIGFLAAEGSGDDNCLNMAACSSPNRAESYLKAAKAVIKGAEMWDPYIASNSHYQRIMHTVERAIFDGLSGAPCDAIYRCRL